KQKAHRSTDGGQIAPGDGRNVAAFDEYASRVRGHQSDDVFQRDALTHAAPSEQTERGACRDIERHIVEHRAPVERLRHAIEPYGGLAHAVVGKRKSVSFTSTTSVTMMTIDDSTTLLVEARPTPRVPWDVVKPKYDATVPMTRPK